MRPPDSVLHGCLRWLDLLKRNAVPQAWTLLANDSRYTDLTRTQYHAALDWLTTAGLLVPGTTGLRTPAHLGSLPREDSAIAVMARALELDPPAWLADADELVPDAGDLPHDAERLAAALGLGANEAFTAVQRAQRKFDAAALAAIGSAGELGLISLLEARWPGCAAHVAEFDDTAGYDIAVTLEGATWHLEVKSTKRRGRLAIYLSRNEFVTGVRDPRWRLVVVGLAEDSSPAAVATVDADVVRERSPHDTHETARWASARYELGATDLLPGLRLGENEPVTGTGDDALFAWAPRPSSL